MHKCYCLAVSVLLCLLLASFGCSTVDAQIRAIEDAIEDHDGIPIRVPDLAEQVKAQKTSSKDSVSFDIEVTLPDYVKIDTKDVSCKSPVFDYSDPDGCRDALYESLRAAMDAYIEGGDFAETTERTLTFDLERSDGEWTAEIDKMDAAKMEQQIAGILSEKADAFSPAPIELRMIEIAEQADDIARAVFLDPALAENCRITDIRLRSGDTFDVALQYPDTAAAFALASDDAFNSCAEAVFSVPEVALVLDSAYSVCTSTLARQTGVCAVALPASGVAALVDASDITADVESARAAAEATAAARIYAKWAALPVDPTAEEVIIGNMSGYKFEIDCRKAKSDYFFEFYKLETKSLNSKQTFVFSVYIPAGKQRHDLLLSPGYYVLYYYYGDGPWYGREYRFGPDGESSYYGPFTAAKGYNYKLTMKW